MAVVTESRGWPLAAGLVGLFVAALAGMLLLIAGLNGGWDSSLAQRPLGMLLTLLAAAWFVVAVMHFRHLPSTIGEAEHDSLSAEARAQGPVPRTLPQSPLWLHVALGAMLASVLIALLITRMAG